MRKFTLIALAAGAAIGSGITAIGANVHAQGAPPGMDRRDMERHGMDRHDVGGGPERWRGIMHRMRQFALIYPTEDRNLSGPDVQKIAEAFLLFNGNHSWKVTEVNEEPERVTFALATSDGGVIARFAMDRHTGRPQRLG